MSKNTFIHPTAIIEEGVKINPGTKVWDHVHIRRNASIGKNCIIGGKTYIAYDVRIGNLVKINSFVYICAGVSIADRVMVSAGVIFTNDKFPRAAKIDREQLLSSAPGQDTEKTQVCQGATIGAGAVIGCGIRLGEYCMIGMGAVVTKDIPAYALAYGVPAKIKGYVCRCGRPLQLKGDCAVCSYCKSIFSFQNKDNLRYLERQDKEN